MSNEMDAAFAAFMAHRVHGNAGTTLIVKEAFEAGAEWAQDAARNPEPKPDEGVLCTDCDKIITDVKRVVIKGDRAMHFNCPAAERHGEARAVNDETCDNCKRPMSEHTRIEFPSQTSVGYEKTYLCPGVTFKHLFLGA